MAVFKKKKSIFAVKNGKMKRILYFILLCTTLMIAGCNSGEQRVKHIEDLGDTPYQEDTILVTLAANPERAMLLLDSAVHLGNIDEYREKFIRASIFTKSLNTQQQDSALAICKTLLQHDSVTINPDNKMSVLNMLINVSRAKRDDNEYLHWATEKATLCREQDQETERFRTQAEIGLVMTHLGQADEGLAKLDESITVLDQPGSIDRMDAFIIAVKRKISALNDLGRYVEVIPLGQRILDRLDHYEQNAEDYAEDSYRLSWSDNPSDRDRYIDFSRAQANGFLAAAYALTGDKVKAREHLDRFDQSGYGKTFSARRMIIPAQMALGMYDEAMATCDEIVRRMGSDTINGDYAVILRDHAIVAHAKGRHAEAYDLFFRHGALTKALNDSLHASEAHDYAARYHAKEQELEIQEKESTIARMNIITVAVVLIALLMLTFAIYAVRKNRIISQKNHLLAQQIAETVALADRYDQLSADTERTEDAHPTTDKKDLNILSNEERFKVLSDDIRKQRLYLDPNFDRQAVCDRYGLTSILVGATFAQGSDYRSVADFIRDCRLRHACHLLTSTDQRTADIAAASGFTRQTTFYHDFKARYSITPTEYREQNKA